MARLEPSKSFTVIALGFNETLSRVNFISVHFGMTFTENHVSTKTRDKVVSKHFIEICRALLWALPSIGSSSSLKPKQLFVVIFATTPSNCSTVISFVTWVVSKTFIKNSRCVFELNNNDNIVIFDGAWFSRSTTR